MNNEHERQAGETEQQYRERVEAAAKAGKRIEWKEPGEDWHTATPKIHFDGWGSGLSYRIAPGQQEPAKQEPAEAREWNIGVALGGFYTLPGDKSAVDHVWVREVLPGDDVDALRADNLLVRMENSKFMDRIDELAGRAQQAESEAETLRAERDAAEKARDNALSAVRDMRAELDKVNAERESVLRQCVNEKNAVVALRALLDRINRDAVSADCAAKREEMTELLHAKDRIIALQDELAVVRNECSTLAGQLNREYATKMTEKGVK